MPDISLILAPIVAVYSCVFVLWLISFKIEDVSIVDIFWGSAFVVSYVSCWSVTDFTVTVHTVGVALLVTLWGGRLSLHLARRNLGHGEDPRYVAFRKAAGPRYRWTSLISVFVLQGTLALLISTPLLATAWYSSNERSVFPLVLGTLVWAVGLMFEAVGDAQLRRFKANPENKGKVMDQGLWRYTRHPNYFGDSLVWWGMWITCVDLPVGPFLVFSPLLMTFFLTKVSGVPMLEKTMIKNKPGYAEYAERTSAFIPLPPKR